MQFHRYKLIYVEPGGGHAWCVQGAGSSVATCGAIVGIRQTSRLYSVLIRKTGKVPSPAVPVVKSPSHISSSASNAPKEKKVEIGRDMVARRASVVVVDDVFATRETLCAVLYTAGTAFQWSWNWCWGCQHHGRGWISTQANQRENHDQKVEFDEQFRLLFEGTGLNADGNPRRMDNSLRENQFEETTSMRLKRLEYRCDSLEAELRRTLD